ncbi:MAG: hypothetical protein CME31_12800 [Gimesia sp.]|uniref:Uncharacterized protein n=1 Tax=Gimesia maris TaxID=122 RepID=A0A3D3R824_9PLAN|nr:hypothetical protein [Gimesia sp.]HCO24258.1 hypothetical protein [Gimesia maris]
MHTPKEMSASVFLSDSLAKETELTGMRDAMQKGGVFQILGSNGSAKRVLDCLLRLHDIAEQRSVPENFRKITARTEGVSSTTYIRSVR